MRIVVIVLVIILLLYVAALACIFIDLKAGIRKAKANGVYRSSYGYRKTVKKIGEYFNMIFILTIIDFIQMALIYVLSIQLAWSLPYIPMFTAIGAVVVATIELKSVREKHDDKEKARVNDAVETLLKIIKNPDNKEIAAAVLETLKIEKDDKKANN